MGLFLQCLELCFTLSISVYSVSWLNKFLMKQFDVNIHKNILNQTFDVLNTFINQNYVMTPNKHYFQNYQANSLKIQPSRDYCQKSDAYKYLHPDVVLQDLYVVREHSYEIPKKIVQEKTFDLLPFLKRYRDKTDSYNNQWPLLASQLFMHYEHLNNEFRYGKEILCLFQKFNHIPGKFSISHKNNLMDNFHKQIDLLKAKNKSQDCIHNASYIPKTYRLYKVDECKEFFRYLNSSLYQSKLVDEGPQFITKAGEEVHRGRGITVLFVNQSLNLQLDYNFGQACHNKTSTILIVQKYINNPYLYKGHKIEFRIYFLITSTDPLIVHVYKKALIKRCAKPYSIYSTEKAAHVCNTAIVKKSMKEEKVEKEEKEEKEEAFGQEPQYTNDEQLELEQDQEDQVIEEEEFFIDWYLEGLQDLLISQGKIQNTKWLENSLYPRVYRSIIHMVRSGQFSFYKDSRVAEFFAVDFILADDLEIYVLECNYNPQILSVTPERIKRNYRMVMDTIEVLQAYTRSRYIRIRKFVKKLLSAAASVKPSQRGMLFTSSAKKNIELVMENPLYKREMLQAFREKLEHSQSISKENLYQKVIDENEKGPKAYHNLIQTKCLIGENVQTQNLLEVFEVLKKVI